MVGLRPFSGRMSVRGQAFAPRGVAMAMASGVVMVPEDRRTEGIFATHSVRGNITVPWVQRLGRAGFYSLRGERRRADEVAGRFRVRYHAIEQPIAALSGGNQQKVLLGRWLETDPLVLILDEPTRGIDVGAKAEIQAELRRLAAQGRAVLVISSDILEALHLGDRIYVMRDGRISGQFSRKEATETKLIQAALPEAAVSPHATPSRTADWRRFVGFGRELKVFGALAILIVALAAILGRSFVSSANLFDVLSAASLVSIAAAGMAQVLIVGGIDISIGSMLGLTGAIAGAASLRGWHPLGAIGLGAGLGFILGALNATIAFRGRIHPIIVTLAGIYVYRGLMLRFTGGYEVSEFSPSFRALTEGTMIGVPKVVLFAVVVHLANVWFLHRTLPGRQLYAVGGSEKAARLAGLSPQRARVVAFSICGTLVGLTSVLWGSYYGKIQSNTGTGFELQVIAAAVIGGCAISGGRGTALGVVAGSVLIAVVYNALILLHVNSNWQGVFIGLLILAPLGLDSWIQRGRRRTT
jgi:ribose/xylose/arabinose/galactoside ABC-type transport system permease subunit/ABC-type branched-subunit amino acid transport system ATPase component